MFRTLGVAEGLPDSRVEALAQDRYGYVWIATQSGLVRHEGRELNLLTHDPADPHALPATNITSLLAHSDGTVWAAAALHGVIEIGPDLLPRRHLQPAADDGILPDDNVWSMTEDCQGNLWLAFMRGGVGRYDRASGDLQLFAQEEGFGLAEQGFQMQIHADAECRIWLVQTERVTVLAHPDAQRFETVLVRDREAGEAVFNSMTELADGSIHVAQLTRLHTVSPEVKPQPVLETAATITGFSENPDGSIYLSTFAGLLRWHPELGQQQVLRRVEGLVDSLPTDAMHGLMRDAEGGLWLVLSRNGLAYLPPGYEAFSRYQPVPGQESGLQMRNLAAVSQKPDGAALWLGSREDGVQRLNLSDGQVLSLHEYFDDEQLATIRPTTTLTHVGHRLVFGWLRELWVYDPRDRRLHTLLEREQVDQGTFSFVRADGDTHVWVATLDAGIMRLDLEKDTREHFHAAGTDRHHLPETEINDLVQDVDGSWWLAGRKGIYQYHPEQGFELRIETAVPVLAMAWMGQDLWLATRFELSVRNRDDALDQNGQYRLTDRLRGGRVFAIFPGRRDEIWLVLSNGLARFRPAQDDLRLYSRDDGLAVAEFVRHSAVNMADGRLAIGSTRGLVLVDPARIRGADRAPPVHVTGLVAGDRQESLAPGHRPGIKLDHRANSVSLDFVALSYVSPDQIRYRLQLEGWDDEWLEMIGQNRHYYSNLRPGRYRFRVQAATPEGLWNEAGDELELTIAQPPWRSAWALAAYGFVLIAGAGTGWRGLVLTRRRRREVSDARQKRLLAEEQRQVVERLNRNLNPDSLARVIGEELLSVTGASHGWFGYCHDQLPAQPAAIGTGASPLSRAQWQRGLRRAGTDTLVVDLDVEGERVACCLLQAGRDGFQLDHQERLRLLMQMAGQALHNLLLIERVKALASRAEQASAAKSEFLATMSHEIRTPLHGVMGMVELLYETESNPAQQELLNTLRQSGQQLQRIIDDVLDISRIEANRLSLDVHPFELTSVLEQLLDLHAPNAARKGLDLRLRMASDLPLLARGDTGRISQVIGNLLSNAVKFTARGGVELVADCHCPGTLELTVCDSGPGIPPDQRDRLFEPFMQLDASITRSHSGSGLGLAICRRLVAAMEGELLLADRPGRGCRFVVRLPVLDEHARPSPLTGLLQGMVLATHLDASTQRAILRLARRWGFGVINARRQPVRPCNVLLIDERFGRSDPALAAWRAQAGQVVRLEVPWRQRPPREAADKSILELRWPLVESRLVGMLLDLAIQQPAGEDNTPTDPPDRQPRAQTG